MDHSSEHGSHDEHGGIHLPDPSVWPLVCGFAALIFGIALVWWSRDRENDFVGPLLGAGAIATIIAGAGWSYEDGKMRRKAQESEQKSSPLPRATQVITFTLAEGMVQQARSASGVLTALNKSDGVVRNLAGFQDLRLTVAPGDEGPLQVMAETTWENRGGLDVYEESRSTLIDIINEHNDEIVPGSLQAFDMEVVRDTKDTTFRYGLGPTAALLGAVLVGGVFVGAGLSLFSDDVATAVDGGGETPAPTNPLNPELVATDNKFAPTTLTVPQQVEITVKLTNRGRTKHNVHFYDREGGSTLADGAEGEIIDGGGTTTNVVFTTPAAGNYFFMCDLHPTEMKGTLVVDANLSAEPPAAASPAASQ